MSFYFLKLDFLIFAFEFRLLNLIFELLLLNFDLHDLWILNVINGPYLAHITSAYNPGRWYVNKSKNTKISLFIHGYLSYNDDVPFRIHSCVCVCICMNLCSLSIEFYHRQPSATTSQHVFSSWSKVKA